MELRFSGRPSLNGSKGSSGFQLGITHLQTLFRLAEQSVDKSDLAPKLQDKTRNGKPGLGLGLGLSG